LPEIPRRIVAVGEGALAGLVAGAVLGGWDVKLNDDLAHGTRWLAAERLLVPALACGLGGAAISAAIAFLAAATLRWASGPRPRDSRGRLALARAVPFLLLSLGSTALVIASGAQRGSCFPLTAYSSARLSLGAIGAVLAAGAALILRRAADARLPQRPVGPLRGSLAACGLLALVLALCLRVAVPYARAARAAGRPSIILVSIDTLRADRLGAYGSDRGLTPHLDALAREGAVFEQASSAAPWTLPSHVSLFTSMLPFDHHVRWTSTHIDPVRSMLAERFRDAGYRTAAFTGAGYVDSSFGFDQGFDVYENHREVDEGGPARISDHALAWAKEQGSAPFFLFVHTYEVHSPFTHTDHAPRDDAGRLRAPFTNKEVEEVHQEHLVLTPAERRYVTGLYDSDVASADAVIGSLLEALRREGILDRAILVILSDHGEDLWDHDARWSPGHGHTLYQELLHVPLIVRAPGFVPAGARIRTPVSLLDVAPTLLEMTGLPPEPDHRGRSLDTTLRSGREPEPKPVWSESVEFGPDRFALREGDRKMIRTPRPATVHSGARLAAAPLEVFDLATDPGEARDLSKSLTAPEVRMAVDLGHRAERALHARSDEVADAHDLPENLQEQLRALGYAK